MQLLDAIENLGIPNKLLRFTIYISTKMIVGSAYIHS